jgi:hypothetical protein
MAFNPLQTQFGTHIEDNLRTGPLFEAAIQAAPAAPGTSPAIAYETIGLPGSYNSPIYIWDIVPGQTTVNSIATAQILPNGNITSLFNTAPAAASGVTISNISSGQTVWNFDTPRNVIFVGSAGATDVTATVNGFDEYGFAMSENIQTPADATTTAGKKAFSAIASISLSGSTTANVSIGNGDVLGFPYKVPQLNTLISINWAGFDWINGAQGGNQAYFDVFNGALTVLNPQNPITTGDATWPATATTGDVRGTINVAAATATDNIKRLIVTMYVTGSDQIYLQRNNINSEVGQTQALIGVAQFSAV